MLRIGTDIVEVSRINKLIKKYKNKFLSRIYSDEEIIYCMDKDAPEIHFAGRFAAKEAIKKTSSKFLKVPYNKIIISNNNNGRPILLHGKILSEKIDVSISHTQKLAVSFAILENDDSDS